MRRIAIVGAGQAGLLVAHGLRRGGYEVTLYSDRPAEAWLTSSRPTGTAARFDSSLALERELGLDHWEREAPKGWGVHLTFCPAIGNRLLTVTGKLDRYFVAIDLRLQSHRWTLDLVERGGRVVVEDVTVERLDEIAAEHDLTVVAVGRGPLARLFERDPVRSLYDRPQRNLTMLIARGAPHRFDGVPFLPVKFNFFATVGEAFWVPYFHKDAGPSWNLLFEARPGGPMDRFQGAGSIGEVHEIACRVVRELMPWDWDWFRQAEPVEDPQGWLVGSFAPTVRKPVGRLPSGRVVTAVGDTAMSLDPIAGQGANNGNKMARNLVESIIARGDRPLDAKWMTETFERFYARHGEPTYRFNHMLLEPITPAAQELLIAQYGCDGTGSDGRQRIADAFIRTFDDPAKLVDTFQDLDKARAFIRAETGRHWAMAGARGRAAIALNQVRQKLGMAPRHPMARPG